MDHRDLRDHIDLRMDKVDGKVDRVEQSLDRIDEKLDSYLERISRNEEAIIWIKGHIRIVMMLGTAAITGLASAVWKLIG